VKRPIASYLPYINRQPGQHGGPSFQQHLTHAYASKPCCPSVTHTRRRASAKFGSTIHATRQRSAAHLAEKLSHERASLAPPPQPLDASALRSRPCLPVQQLCFLVSGQFRCISKCIQVSKYGKVPRAIGFFNLLLC
jgi:hypothetical protein